MLLRRHLNNILLSFENYCGYLPSFQTQNNSLSVSSAPYVKGILHSADGMHRPDWLFQTYWTISSYKTMRQLKLLLLQFFCCQKKTACLSVHSQPVWRRPWLYCGPRLCSFGPVQKPRDQDSQRHRYLSMGEQCWCKRSILAHELK